MRIFTKHLVAFAALIAFQPALGHAAESKDNNDVIVQAIKDGKLLIDVRYRFEWKTQEGFAEDAYANTIRTRLGFKTADFHGFRVLAEFENVASIGDDHFNSTTNGRSQFPAIADPDATEVNRAQITFTGVDRMTVTVGRQRMNLANQRFIGAVDFRQNQQTFDAARLTLGLIDNVTVDYAYISRVHRIFGDDHPAGEFDSDSHATALELNGGRFGKITAYGLLLDFDEAPALSSSTFGFRYENEATLDESRGIAAGLTAEYAAQRDYAANPVDYSESYLHAEGRVLIRAFGAKVGYERLGGNGVIGFSTPLATLHKFQGFADVFLSTPATGIEDLYATLSYGWKTTELGDVNIFATYHDFESQIGAADFGEEIDAGLSAAFRKHWSVEVKGAIYDGTAAYPDRSLIWASLRFRY